VFSAARGNEMNQGARDANAESARRGAQDVQFQILAELRQISDLLVVLIERSSPRNLPEHLWPKQ
jgi:hypothetical protein